MRRTLFVGSLLLAATAASAPAQRTTAQHHAAENQQAAEQARLAQLPWMNKSLPPDQRAGMVLKQMTLDEKLLLLHGNGMAREPQWQMPLTRDSNGGAGYIAPIPRLGVPGVNMSDAAYGVRSSGANGRYSTTLPSNLGAASSWDRRAAYSYGDLIARELRAQGYNMSLGGGVDLTREPRNGRTFEYLGEDPVLAGTLVGQLMTAEKNDHVVSDIKHYAVNDQETGRNIVDAVISKRAMRESDLLVFQIGIRDAKPGMVMCSYNRVNGPYTCQSDYLLKEVLKGDWNYPGFVISDWGATHSTVASSHAGLDHEEPTDRYYGAALKGAVQAGQVSQAEIDDHARRILRSYFDDGVFDDPVEKGVVDVDRDLDVAQQVEEGSIVLLKNEGNTLPLDANRTKSIAIIGAHADIGMISGGGSAQVDPPGGNAISPPGEGATHWQEHIWFPTSPLRQLQTAMPGAKLAYNPGDDPAQAAALAKQSDLAIVFVQQWEAEGLDLPTLALPDNQDALVEAVAAANPHTVVVLETGTAVLMPWKDKVEGIVEAWYGGSRGATALARVLTGKVNPSGKLAMTFPQSDADLPHPQIAPLPPEDKGAGSGGVNDSGNTDAGYSVHYDEALQVGYKWYEAQHKPVLFPFGYGLSYTTFAYSGLEVTPGPKPQVRFTVRNTGSRAGAEVAELYADLPAEANEPFHRLVGFDKVNLEPGESRVVTLDVDPLFLAVYDEAASRMKVLPGKYTFAAGPSSEALPLRVDASMAGAEVSR